MVATAAIGAALIAGGAFSTVGSGAVVVASMIGAYLVTDMGTAMVHVVIDNLDCEKIPESLPWLRRLVEDFQNHHENPRDIVKREFANHTADAQVITTPMLIGLAIAAITRPHLAPLIAAATVSANAAVLSPEFHKRSHMRPDESAPAAPEGHRAGGVHEEARQAPHPGTQIALRPVERVHERVLGRREVQADPRGSQDQPDPQDRGRYLSPDRHRAAELEGESGPKGNRSRARARTRRDECPGENGRNSRHCYARRCAQAPRHDGPIEPCTYKAVGALQKVEQRRLAAMGEREGGEG